MIYVFRLEGCRPVIDHYLGGIRDNEVAYCVAQTMSRMGMLFNADALRRYFGSSTMQAMERVICDQRFQTVVFAIARLSIAKQPTNGFWEISYNTRADELLLEYVPLEGL